jgi:hypothetical protein
MGRKRNSAADDARLTAQVDAEIADETRKAEEERERQEQRLTSTLIVRAPAMLTMWLEIKRREEQAKLPGHRVSTSDVVRGIITKVMRDEQREKKARRT